MINWTGPYGASQQSTQRFGSLPTLRDAKMYVFLKRNCRQLYDAKKYIIISFLWNLSLHHEVWLIKNSKYQYIHFFQSAYAAKRRIDCDCDISMHDRCRCFRLLRNEGLWPTDKWRYHEFKSSEESLFFSKKKKTFSDYQTYPLRLKINKHCFPSILLVRTICRY